MQMQRVNKQQGFTIIELVVVILLLGILAATALPRFIDVTTQAHDSAFDATAGGFVTGTALYRAEWVARGQRAAQTPLNSFGGLRGAPGYQTGAYDADGGATLSDSTFTPGTFTGPATGYPLATENSVTEATFDADNCVEVFSNVLQEGAPSIAATSDTLTLTSASTIDTSLTTVLNSTTADFIAFAQDITFDTGFARLGAALSSQTTGDPSNYTDSAKACFYVYAAEVGNYDRAILYVPWTGRVSVYTTSDNLITGATYDGPEV